MTIYTRAGDSGETELLNGRKLSKNDPRVEACGTVDELNALLGLVVAFADEPELKELLTAVQRDLFLIGAELAGSKKIRRITLQKISDLENVIDKVEEKLPTLRRFILPGGTKMAALLHVARAVCRRAERRVVAVADREKINKQIITYLNRLSDMLFVLARAANRKKRVEEPLWKISRALSSKT